MDICLLSNGITRPNNEIFSKVIKILEQRHWHRSDASIANFEQISQLFLSAFTFDSEQLNAHWLVGFISLFLLFMWGVTFGPALCFLKGGTDWTDWQSGSGKDILGIKSLCYLNKVSYTLWNAAIFLLFWELALVWISNIKKYLSFGKNR